MSINKQLTTLETNVSENIFTSIRDEYEIIFETNYGIQMQWVVFESLYPTIKVHSYVIDAWAHVLNFEEDRKDPDRNGRIFCSTGAMSEDIVENKMDMVAKFCIFKETMDVFLATTKISILEADFVDLLFQYLSYVKHPRAKHIKVCGTTIMHMSWKTKNNVVDCGIFIMRHMETFHGQTGKEWKSGFVKESDDQDEQIHLLRQKYLTKILLSEVNIWREKVVEEAEVYDKLTDMEKSELSAETEDRIESRLKMFA